MTTVYVVTRRADVGEAEVFAVLEEESEADDLAEALNERDAGAYASEVWNERVYPTARHAWGDLMGDSPFAIPDKEQTT